MSTNLHNFTRGIESVEQRLQREKQTTAHAWDGQRISELEFEERAYLRVLIRQGFARNVNGHVYAIGLARCPDCLRAGERKGHINCEYPS